MEGQEMSLEQREMNEPDGDPQREHVGDHLPIRPPSLGDGLAGGPGRRAAHDHRDENEQPEGAFFVKDALHRREVRCQWWPPSRYAARTWGSARSSLPVPAIVIRPLTIT